MAAKQSSPFNLTTCQHTCCDKAPAAVGAEFLGFKQPHQRAVAALEEAPRWHKEDALPIPSITLTNDHLNKFTLSP